MAAEVTIVSGHCVWVLIDDEELALPYSEFPCFKAATIQQVPNVLRPTSEHLHWLDLDVELSVESIRHPERYPLMAKSIFNPAIDLARLHHFSEPTETRNPHLFAGR